MTEEHRLIRQTAEEFAADVLAQNDRLEAKDWDLSRELLRRAGELGLLGTDVPEEFGGFVLDKVSSAIIAGCLGQAGSFSSTYGAHANLAILPIRMFGTDAQKQRYLPSLVTADIVGAYCLSETGSGSDALGARPARAARTTGASCSTARRCGLPTADSPTSTWCSPRSTESTSPRSSSNGRSTA